ncbi:hypothetical protein [Leifsonia sp. NPDC058248]|uniref:hypothetical protein n=1 Tax=Leifsonia sp. NPDC058248 TaxID=3346402 RepID=UPI0036DEA61A
MHDPINDPTLTTKSRAVAAAAQAALLMQGRSTAELDKLVEGGCIYVSDLAEIAARSGRSVADFFAI